MWGVKASCQVGTNIRGFLDGHRESETNLTETLLGGDTEGDRHLTTLHPEPPSSRSHQAGSYSSNPRCQHPHRAATCFHSQSQRERSLSLKVSAFKRTIGLWKSASQTLRLWWVSAVSASGTQK